MTVAYFAAAVACSAAAKHLDRSPVGWLLVAVFLTPYTAGVLLAGLGFPYCCDKCRAGCKLSDTVCRGCGATFNN